MRLLLSFIFVFSFVSTNTVFADDQIETNFFDNENYDPANPEVEKILEAQDFIHELVTGQPSFLPNVSRTDCYQSTCTVWAKVTKATQTMELYVGGVLQDSWAVSTGAPGHETPKFDRHPDGRIYDEYSSKSYPGGDYMGLGNMPYAVFIKGGYALHGTPESNWKDLGKKASHGCIRMHPENGKIFNRLVREYGVGDTWITVK